MGKRKKAKIPAVTLGVIGGLCVAVLSLASIAVISNSIKIHREEDGFLNACSARGGAVLSLKMRECSKPLTEQTAIGEEVIFSMVPQPEKGIVSLPEWGVEYPLNQATEDIEVAAVPADGFVLFRSKKAFAAVKDKCWADWHSFGIRRYQAENRDEWIGLISSLANAYEAGGAKLNNNTVEKALETGIVYLRSDNTTPAARIRQIDRFVFVESVFKQNECQAFYDSNGQLKNDPALQGLFKGSLLQIFLKS